MSFVTECRIYYIRKIKEAVRNPVILSFTVFMPLMYLCLYAPLLKGLIGLPGFEPGNVLNTFLPGMLVSLSVFGGAFAGFRLCDEIRQGIVERFRVTPTSRLAILIGAVGKDVSNVLVQALIFTGAAIPFGLHLYLPGLLILLVVLSINTALFASYSYAIALRFQNEDSLIPFTQVASLPVLLLAGFLLPMDLAPAWLKAASHADPVYYSVKASRDLMNGHLDRASIWQVFAVNVPLAAAVLVWAGASFRKTIR
jgi:ABC-2 type transport system permease protein